MKNLTAKLALSLLVSTAASYSMAATTKVCNGIGEAKGTSFEMVITKKTVQVTSASDDSIGVNNDAPYKANGSINGRDGNVYLSYSVSSEEGDTNLLVDEALLDVGTKGYAKFRWRGESFAESVYLCKDSE